ncbi:WG repeat-containing protein [Flavobacterium sp.]|uniref:WG repeat-containing protein n=1 Tax=Flavobacterium sp. TaxID=239 RepID=UPI004034995E
MWLKFTKIVCLKIILLFLPLFSIAQEGFPLQQTETKPAIIYYNFYNGTQIIKVDMLNHSRMRVAQMPPRALTPDMILQTMPTANIYFIRDTSGKILQRFCPYPFDESQLLPPGKVKTIPHSLNFGSGIMRTPHGMLEPEEQLPNFVIKIYESGKKGLMDTLGNILLEPKFDRLQYAGSMYFVTLNNLHGVYGEDLKALLPTEYKILEYKGNGLFFGYKDGQYVFIESNGTIRRKMDYDAIERVYYPIADHHYIYRKGDKFGLLDTLYKEVTPLLYDAIEHQDDGFSGMNSDRLWALMDKNGKQITDFKYYEVHNSIKGDIRLAAKEINGRRAFGLVGADGREISEFIYDRIETFSSTHFLVAIDNMHGLMDSNGKVTVAMAYDKIKQLDDHIIAELPDGKYGLIDANGIELLSFKHQKITRVYNGYAQVMADNKDALVDLKTRKEYFFPTESIMWFEGSLVGVYRERKMGVLTLDGKVVIPIEYQQAGHFSNGLVQLVQNNKYGYADASGKLIVPVIYDQAHNWPERPTIIASLNGKWGSLDRKGKVLVPFEYDNVHFTEKGNMKFSKGEDTFLVNTKGKFIALE